MATAYETVTVRQEGLRISDVIWRRFRKPMPGMVERVLDLNQGIAEVGADLPLGTVITIPIDATPASQVSKRSISLWD